MEEKVYFILSVVMIIIGVVLLLYVLSLALSEYESYRSLSIELPTSTSVIETINNLAKVLTPILGRLIWVGVAFAVAVAILSYGIKLSRRV